jgi:predicted ATPase/DNA-binding CsgD family transcriptional regulator
VPGSVGDLVTGQHGDDAPARVRALRESLGLSQEQFAQQLNVSFATVNRWEGGRHEMSRSARSRFEQLATAAAEVRRDAPPESLSTLVDRPVLAGAIAREITDGTLITLTGPAGAGKTRLAVEVCRRLDAERSAAFVSLRDASKPDQVRERIAAAVDGRSTVVVLDGVERWAAEVRDLMAATLPSHPKLRVVVTSQQALQLAGERVWPVPLLECPAVNATTREIADSEAGRLFDARARACSPGFTMSVEVAGTVAELCREVDGLPSAIEVLAGWAGMLSVAQILERRHDLLYPVVDAADPDLTSQAEPSTALRAAVGASFALLSAGDRSLARTLAVFAGSFTIADAVAVTALDEAQVVRSLRRLVDRSWLGVELGHPANSYRMLKTLRLFAIGQLVDSADADEVHHRHARHFAQLARSSELGLAGVDRTEWVVAMTRASIDIDAALAWAAQTRDDTLGLTISAALWLWWLTTGRLADGRRWLAEFVDRAISPLPELVARAQCAAAVLAVEGGDYLTAIDAANVALREFEALGDIDGAARAATALGSAERYLGRSDTAKWWFQLAMNHRREIGDDRGLAAALNNMALLALDSGELDATRSLFEESLLVKRRLGEPRTVAIGLANLSDVLIRIGLVGQALDSLHEAAVIAADLADSQLLATIACNLGDAACVQGDLVEAIGHYQVSLDAYRASGGAHDLVPALCGMARALHASGRTRDAVIRLREAEAIAIATTEHVAEIRAALVEIGQTTALALPDGLTPRQAQILRHLAGGSSNKTIAEDLHISVATVERHLATTYRKLGLHGRVDAARYALRHGLAVPTAAASAPQPEYMFSMISNPNQPA